MLLALWLNLAAEEEQPAPETARRPGGGGKTRRAKQSRRIKRYWTVYEDDELPRQKPPAPILEPVVEPAAPIADPALTEWLARAGTTPPVKQLPTISHPLPGPVPARAVVEIPAAAPIPAERTELAPVEDDEEDEIEMLLLHIAA